MFAGSGSIVRVVGRWSRFTVRGWQFAVHGSWVAVRGSQFAIPALRRHTIVARNVCYADVRAVWYAFMSLSQRFAVRDSGAQVPHYFRAERPLWDVRAVWHVSRVVSDMH